MITIPINIPDNKYEIYIEKGIFKIASKIIKKTVSSKKAVIITDSNVNELYGDELINQLKGEGIEADIIVLPFGESSKSMDMLQHIYDKLIDFSINRDGILIALGGGVIGDITGFAAATFLRGINYIQIPTSIIAQVDSSIGGKVAVNLNRGKNLVGNFYHPKAVIIDPDLLNSLKEKYYSDGMAEVIKYAVIKDKVLFDKLKLYKNKSELFDNIEYVIATCCNIKKEIVERDEKDKGDRMLLNFGHTIGHGVEKYYDYITYSHGEAVAIGMYNIAYIGEKLGMTSKGCSEDIKRVLIKYNLPYSLGDIDVEKLINIMKRDKKVFDRGLSFIMIKNIGESFINNIPLDELSKYMIYRED